MLSVISTLVFSGADLVLGGWLAWQAERVPRNGGTHWAAGVLPGRWLLAVTLMCGAGAAVTTALIALVLLASRGLEGAVEAGLCARIGFYVALGAWGLRAWGGKWQPRFRWRRGPKLLGPVRQSVTPGTLAGLPKPTEEVPAPPEEAVGDAASAPPELRTSAPGGGAKT